MTLQYKAPAWLPGGHAQTIWSAKLALRDTVQGWHRERWPTPDGDFIDVDFVRPVAPLHTPLSGQLTPTPRSDCANEPPVLFILFHGLEGSRHSHYAAALAAWAQDKGITLALPHFRGCSGEINLAPRAYHSGDFEEVGWILARFAQQYPDHHRVALGVSLGGNALLRWAEEVGSSAAQSVSAVSSLCSPIDLRTSGLAIGSGFSRMVYTPMFLRTMKPKALRKWQQFPGLFDKDRMLAARDLYEFDDVFTAPLHGFRDTDDYWHRASAKPQLERIRIPALVVNARNDPFVPAACLPASVPGDWVRLWQPREGGHVGFVSGAFPGHLRALPLTVGEWLLRA